MLGRGVILQLIAIAAAACMWRGPSRDSIPAPQHLFAFAFPAQRGEGVAGPGGVE